jgi:hypothetical protein
MTYPSMGREHLLVKLLSHLQPCDLGMSKCNLRVQVRQELAHPITLLDRRMRFAAVRLGVRVQPCRLQSEVRAFRIEFSVSPFSARPYLTRCCTRKAECHPGRPGARPETPLWLWNLQDSILPLVRVGSRPNQQQRLNYIRYRCMLLNQKHAGTGAAGLKELSEMSRHCLQIGSDQNPAFCGGEGQDLRVGNPLQVCVVGGEKIDGGSRRKQPLTIASRRLASARKRIIRQLRRACTWWRIRANFSLMSGGVGCVFVNSSSSRSRSVMSSSTSLL